MKYIFSILFVLGSLTCYAAIYMEVDQNGRKIYSDTPLTNNAQVIDTPKINETSSGMPNKLTTSPTPILNENLDVTKSVTNLGAYSQFEILLPKNQQTIQNQPSIHITFLLQPDLQSGDKIQVYLDGQPWGKALASTTFEFSAPERGTHVISAKLLDRENQILKQANEITVYIHQAHIPTQPAVLSKPI